MTLQGLQNGLWSLTISTVKGEGEAVLWGAGNLSAASRLYQSIAPGSGNHWSDQVWGSLGAAGMERNSRMMSQRTFDSFYGITDQYGRVNEERRTELAQAAGTPVNLVFASNSNKGALNYVSNGADRNAWFVDGKLVGVTKKGANYLYAPLDGNWELATKGIWSMNSSSSLSDLSLGAGAAGLAGTTMATSNGSFRITNGSYNGSAISPKYYGSGWTGGSVAKIKTYNIAKAGSGLATGANVVTTGLSYYQIANGQASPITYVDASVGTVGLSSSVASYFFGIEIPIVGQAMAFYGAARIGWDLGLVYGPSKWYGKEDNRWFK